MDYLLRRNRVVWKSSLKGKSVRKFLCACLHILSIYS